MRRLAAGVLALLLGGPVAAATGDASDDASADAPDRRDWSRLLDNDLYRLSLDVRNRAELANFESFHRSSQAYTTRIRAGVGSKPYHGLSGFAELESSFSYDNGQYWDVVSSNPRRRTPIADPPKTDLNQLFLRYENDALLGLDAIVGRQRILLDDQRFVGNVGWRQNEQTYDAFLGGTSLGVAGLRARYGYIRKVHRVFGNQGGAATRDFDSDSHLVNVSWQALPALSLTAFAYLLDFRSDAPVFSSNSYGLRASGTSAVAADWRLDYAASYAWQVDAGRNPVSYEAHYAAAEGGVGFAPAGTLGVGYELLGSDGGEARFVTPLATAHAFNGFADVFTDNGGVNGLQDLYVFVAPRLPWKLSGRFVYHHFWSDHHGTALGEEYDVLLTRPITPWLSALAKAALFESKTRMLADGWRAWLELTLHY